MLHTCTRQATTITNKRGKKNVRKETEKQAASCKLCPFPRRIHNKCMPTTHAFMSWKIN